MSVQFAIKAPGGWTNVSAFCIDLAGLQENRKAFSIPDSVSIDVQAQLNGTLLGFEPSGGQQWMLWDDTDPSTTALFGIIVRRQAKETVENRVYTLTCDSILKRLKKHVPNTQFDSATYPTDASRILKLFTDNFNYIDAVSFVQQNVTYNNTTPDVFSKTTVLDVLEAIAASKGISTDPGYPVAPRIWRIRAEWVNPANISLGVVVYLEYYSSARAQLEPMPLTNSADGWANWVNDDFDRADSATSLGQALTSQAWAAINGTWGISSNRAYLAVGPGAEYLATVPSQTAIGEIQATVDIVQSGIGIVVRAAGSGVAWSGIGLVVNGTQYALIKRTGGVTTVISTIAVTATAGDIIKLAVSATGNVFTPYVNGVAYPTLTDALNSTSTFHGLRAVQTGVGRLNNFKVRYLGAAFVDDWEEDTDWGSMIQKVAIQGPGADPAAISWDSNNLSGATGSNDGSLQKTLNPAKWQAGQSVILGQIVQPTKPDGQHRRAANGGTTGITEPAWNTTEGGTTPDNGISWITDTWDGKGASSQVFTEDGGYIETVIAERQVILDNYDRPDHPSNLVKTTDGSNYTITGTNAVFGTQSNRAKFVSGTGIAKALVDSGVSTCTVELQLAIRQADAGMVFRYSDENNFWYFRDETSAWKVYKRRNNVDTLMYTIATAPVNNDIVKANLTDDQVQIYFGAGGVTPVFQTTITDSHNQGATMHGLLAYTGTQTTVRWDNFKVKQAYTKKLLGFGPTNTGLLWDHVPFGILFTAQRTAQVLETGVLKGSSVGYQIGDRFRVEMRREDQAGNTPLIVRYYKNNSVFYTSTVNPVPTGAAPFYANGLLYHFGATLDAVTCRRYTYGIFSNSESITDWGDDDNFWAGDMVKDDSLDTYQKRADRWSQISDLFGQPSISITLKSRQRYREGRQVLLNIVQKGWIDQLRIVQSVEVDRSNPFTPMFTYVLGDAFVEWGDVLPYGLIRKGVGNDHTDPPIPTNLGLGVSTQDGQFTVSQEFIWDQTQGDEEIIMLRVRLAGGQPNIQNCPAGQNRYTFRSLTPNTPGTVEIQARDYNNNFSGWSLPVPFTTASLGKPPAPVITYPTDYSVQEYAENLFHLFVTVHLANINDDASHGGWVHVLRVGNSDQWFRIPPNSTFPYTAVLSSYHAGDEVWAVAQIINYSDQGSDYSPEGTHYFIPNGLPHVPKILSVGQRHDLPNNWRILATLDKNAPGDDATGGGSIRLKDTVTGQYSYFALPGDTSYPVTPAFGDVLLGRTYEVAFQIFNQFGDPSGWCTPASYTVVSSTAAPGNLRLDTRDGSPGYGTGTGNDFVQNAETGWIRLRFDLSSDEPVDFYYVESFYLDAGHNVQDYRSEQVPAGQDHYGYSALTAGVQYTFSITAFRYGIQSTASTFLWTITPWSLQQQDAGTSFSVDYTNFDRGSYGYALVINTGGTVKIHDLKVPARAGQWMSWQVSLKALAIVGTATYEAECYDSAGALIGSAPIGLFSGVPNTTFTSYSGQMQLPAGTVKVAKRLGYNRIAGASGTCYFSEPKLQVAGNTSDIEPGGVKNANIDIVAVRPSQVDLGLPILYNGFVEIPSTDGSQPDAWTLSGKWTWDTTTSYSGTHSIRLGGVALVAGIATSPLFRWPLNAGNGTIVGIAYRLPVVMAGAIVARLRYYDITRTSVATETLTDSGGNTPLIDHNAATGGSWTTVTGFAQGASAPSTAVYAAIEVEADPTDTNVLYIDSFVLAGLPLDIYYMSTIRLLSGGLWPSSAPAIFATANSIQIGASGSYLDALGGVVPEKGVCLLLTNKSGGSVAPGDVVIISTGTAKSFTTTTTAGQISSWVGVVQAAIANNASGLVAVHGYVPVVNLSSSAAIGDYLKTASVAKQATPGSAIVAGVFARTLDTGVSPPAILFGCLPIQSTLTTDSVTINKVFAGPPVIGPAAPTFRSLVANDLPSTMNGTNFTGDLTVDASGGTTGSPRILGLSNLGAARIQVGDAFTSLQSANGDRFQIQAYHGIEIWGARATTGSTQAFAVGGGAADPSLNVYGSQSATIVMAVTAASAQSTYIQEWRSSTPTRLSAIDQNGAFVFGSNKVVGARDTGWTAPTGSGTKGGFATGSVTLVNLAQNVKAIIDALTTHGLLGT